jgi:hypothetical protein
VAKKQKVTASGPAQAARRPSDRTTAVAEYVGASLGELMNRKDALAKQLAGLERQIAAVRKQVSAKLEQLPALGRAKKAPVRKKAKTGNRKHKRPLPPDEPMVAQAERARAAEAKGRTAARTRRARASGNR